MRLVIELTGFGLIVANVFLGIRFGLLRRGIALAGVYAGIGAASLVGIGVANFFNNNHEPDALYRAAWWFVGIMFLVIVTVEILGFLYDDRITRVASLMFDRTAGALMGALVGFLQIAMVCLVVLAVGNAQAPNERSPLPANRTSYTQGVDASFLGGRVNARADALLNVFRPVLPSDLPAHLAENADTTHK
ncbi:MAG TPA: CvpA family protein [Candidatus Dormibacteraeota bacterium]